jgi:hypothetical protein
LNDVPVSARRRVPWFFLGFCCILAACIGFVYWPALEHPPRADQWDYFAETLGRDRFPDLIAHTYSFNRTRIFNPGDTQLFRPVFFVWLAAQKACFGTQFRLCQACGIGLHILVSCLLLAWLLQVFRAVQQLQPRLTSPAGWLPYALTLFFSLNFSIVEQVIWYNIQPYLLALALMLGAANLIARATLDPEPTPTKVRLLLVVAWCLALVAAFTYELGQFFAVCAGCYLALYWRTGCHGHHVSDPSPTVAHAMPTASGSPRKAVSAFLAFAAIVVIYQSVNLLDRWHHRRTFDDDISLVEMFQEACAPATVENTARYGVYTLAQPFLPWNLGSRILCIGKLLFDEQLWKGEVPVTPALFLGFGVLLVLTSLSVVGLTRLLANRRWLPLALAGIPLGTAAAHASLIILGRMNLRPWSNVLGFNPYYTYVTLLLVIAGVAAALAAAAGRRTERLPLRLLVGGLVIGLTLLSYGSGLKVHRLNSRIRRDSQVFVDWNDPLRDFFRAHEHEPGFQVVLAVDSAAIPECAGLPAPFIFYSRFLDCAQPTYVLHFEGKQFVARSMEEWRSRPGAGAAHFLPKLERLAVGYDVFFDGREYAAVAHGRTFQFLTGTPVASCCRGADLASVVEEAKVCFHTDRMRPLDAARALRAAAKERKREQEERRRERGRE